MSEVQLQFDARGRGAFYLEENKEKLGEMVVGISGTALTVYHTEVDPKMEGQGLAKKMFEFMIKYAREKGLMVVPLCEFVHAQFKRHPEEFADVWKR